MRSPAGKKTKKGLSTVTGKSAQNPAEIRKRGEKGQESGIWKKLG